MHFTEGYICVEFGFEGLTVAEWSEIYSIIAGGPQKNCLANCYLHVYQGIRTVRGGRLVNVSLPLGEET